MPAIVQPALIIGLGGSGIEIVRRFKKRFRNSHPQTPYVQFIGIDTAPQAPATRQSPLLDDDEFTWASDFQMQYYVGAGNVEQHPEIRAWWRGYDNLPLKYVNAGAGQRRPIGRLAMFIKFDPIAAHISRAASTIFGADVFWALPDHYRRVLNVYLVSSTCGGTGTGMFLDLAYVARHVIKRTQPAIDVRSRAILLMPSVFLGTGQVPAHLATSLQRNAYGALAELDYAMSPSRTLGPVSYPSGTRVERNDPPFRSVYLVGNQVAAGAVERDHEKILDRAAVHLQIELASPLSDTGVGILDNTLTALAQEPEVQGKPRSYSSLNGDWLELPSKFVIRRWTRTFGCLLVDRLQNTANPAETSADGPEMAKLRSLFSAAGVNPYMPRVDDYVTTFQDIGPKGTDPTELRRAAQALESEAQARLKGTNVDSAVPPVKALVDEMRANAVSAMVNHGVTAAINQVTQHRNEIQQWLAKAQGEAAGKDAGVWLQQFLRKLDDTAKGLLKTAASNAKAQRELVIDSLESARVEWTANIRGRIGRAASSQLPKVVMYLEETLDDLQRLRATLGSAGAIIGAQDDDAPVDGSAPHGLTAQAIDDEFVEGSRPQRMLELAIPLLRDHLLDGSRESAEKLAQRLWEVAHTAVLEVAPDFLSGLSIPADQIAERASSLSPLADYTAAWGTLPASSRVSQLRLIGLPATMDAQRGTVEQRLPAQLRHTTQIIASGDQERVVLTAQDHGFPLFALNEIAICADAYRQATPLEKRMVFTLPEPDVQTWDLIPPPPGEADRWFAVGLALGWIRKVGTHYEYRSPRSGGLNAAITEDIDEPRDRRQAALDSFRQLGYTSEVKQAVELRMKAEGNDAVRRDLKTWLDEGTGFEEDLKHVASYIKVL
jgi:hypothetical protein